MDALKVYSFDEVAKHNKTKDCWLIIYGKVLDVTPYMKQHPGGEVFLMTATGKDATHEFEDEGHSEEAKALLDKYVIGKIDETTLPEEYITFKPGAGSKGTTEDLKNAPRPVVKILQLLLLILGLALAALNYTKKH